MKCPKCGYNSFEYLDSCKKCNNDLSGYKASHGIRAVVLPFRQMEHVFSPAEEKVPQFSTDAGGVATETDEGMFSWHDESYGQAAPESEALPSQAGSAVEPEPDPFSFDLDLPAEPEKEQENAFKEFSFDDLHGENITDSVPTDAHMEDEKPAPEEPAFGDFSFDELTGEDASDSGAPIPAQQEEELPAQEKPAFGEFSFDTPYGEADPSLEEKTGAEQMPDAFVAPEAGDAPEPGPKEFSFDDIQEAGAAFTDMAGGGNAESDEPDNALVLDEFPFEEDPPLQETGEDSFDSLGLSPEEYESLFGAPPSKKKSKLPSEIPAF